MPNSVSTATSVNFFAASGTGNPTVANRAARYRVNSGGRRNVIITAHDGPIIVTLRVSADDTTFTNSAAAVNGSTLVNQTIAAGTSKTFDLLLREGTDKFVDILATGGGRGEVQFDQGGLTQVPLQNS